MPRYPRPQWLMIWGDTKKEDLQPEIAETTMLQGDIKYLGTHPTGASSQSLPWSLCCPSLYCRCKCRDSLSSEPPLSAGPPIKLRKRSQKMKAWRQSKKGTCRPRQVCWQCCTISVILVSLRCPMKNGKNQNKLEIYVYVSLIQVDIQRKKTLWHICVNDTFMQKITWSNTTAICRNQGRFFFSAVNYCITDEVTL